MVCGPGTDRGRNACEAKSARESEKKKKERKIERNDVAMIHDDGAFLARIRAAVARLVNISSRLENQHRRRQFTRCWNACVRTSIHPNEEAHESIS